MVTNQAPFQGQSVTLAIHPSALPNDARVLIQTRGVEHPQPGGGSPIGALSVKASQKCTGS